MALLEARAAAMGKPDEYAAIKNRVDFLSLLSPP